MSKPDLFPLEFKCDKCGETYKVYTGLYATYRPLSDFHSCAFAGLPERLQPRGGKDLEPR